MLIKLRKPDYLYYLAKTVIIYLSL